MRYRDSSSRSFWRPQLNAGTLIWNDLSSSRGGLRSVLEIDRLLSLLVEVNESAGEVGGLSTVDHADIRGSAGAAFMVIIRRELPRTGLAGLAPHNVLEDSPP